MAVAMTLALGGAPAMAQLATPAELPPAGYDGLEYVDSAGCVFARIDVGGRVEWVPRVGQDRQQLCGMEPSVAECRRPMPEPDARTGDRGRGCRHPHRAGGPAPHRNADHGRRARPAATRHRTGPGATDPRAGHPARHASGLRT
jgi:hypothetical protein